MLHHLKCKLKSLSCWIISWNQISSLIEFVWVVQEILHFGQILSLTWKQEGARPNHNLGDPRTTQTSRVKLPCPSSWFFFFFSKLIQSLVTTFISWLGTQPLACTTLTHHLSPPKWSQHMLCKHHPQPLDPCLLDLLVPILHTTPTVAPCDCQVSTSSPASYLSTS